MSPKRHGRYLTVVLVILHSLVGTSRTATLDARDYVTSVRDRHDLGSFRPTDDDDSRELTYDRATGLFGPSPTTALDEREVELQRFKAEARERDRLYEAERAESER